MCIGEAFCGRAATRPAILSDVFGRGSACAQLAASPDKPLDHAAFLNSRSFGGDWNNRQRCAVRVHLVESTPAILNRTADSNGIDHLAGNGLDGIFWVARLPEFADATGFGGKPKTAKRSMIIVTHSSDVVSQRQPRPVSSPAHVFGHHDVDERRDFDLV